MSTLRRKIGCCTWIFGDEPLAGIVRRARRAQLDGVELHGRWKHTNPGDIADILGNAELEVFSLTPTDSDPSSADPAERESSLDEYFAIIDFAAALGGPIVSFHGRVGRISYDQAKNLEDAHLLTAARKVCARAAAADVPVVFELLNRYETHQIQNVEAGLAFLAQANAANLKLLADSYHMNIEEADPPGALTRAGNNLGLYHAADSNRGAIGDGHIDFSSQIETLDEIAYTGPLILETTAPGPNPFTPNKGTGFVDTVEDQLARSVTALHNLSA
ncbi:MAG: sugar phosphate isomerase/epimerase family protein [Pseudomonadota bacterium]